MCLYLTKREATYYFRRAIPDHLQPAFKGAGEFMFSLRTKDREEAKRRRSAEAIRTDKLLDEAANRLARDVSPVPAWQGPTEVGLEHMALRDQDEAERQARWEARAPLRQRLEAAFEKSTLQIRPEEAAARDLLRDLREELTIEEERRIARRVRRAEERRGIEPKALPQRAPASPEAPVQSEAVDERAVMLDSTIIDQWAAERKVSPKGKYDHQSVVRWLYDRIGRKPVDQITRKDVLAFKAKLVEEGQSSGNIKQKLSRLRTLLQWAFVNDYAPSNAAQGIEIRNTDVTKNRRKPFDLPALKAIFESPVYRDGERPKALKGEAAYWLPLLALFTGARLEEVGQLRPKDVMEEHYPDANGDEACAWFIHIREDEEDDLKLKNAASERRVPVHPELERLGFVRFVQAALAANRERLFPDLKANKFGRLTAKWGENWSVYLRTVCGITDRRMVFHSFRHTFKDYARHAGILEGIQRQIMGHSGDDVADDYGSGHSPYRLVEGMKLYKVPGLKLP